MKQTLLATFFAVGMMAGAPTANAQQQGQLSDFCVDFFNDVFSDSDVQMSFDDAGFIVVTTRSEGDPVGDRRAELLLLIHRNLNGRENNCLNFVAVDPSVTSEASTTASRSMEGLFATGG